MFDAGVYWKIGNFNKIFLTVYVDDIVIAADPRDIENVATALVHKFRLKNLGRVGHLLGMAITLLPRKMLYILQTAYIDGMLKKFGLADAKSVRSPQMHNEPTLRVEGNPNIWSTVLGQIWQMQRGRWFDTVVRTQRRNSAMPKRIMRYLHDTKHIGLVYRYAYIGKDSIKLDVFADANHVGCPEPNRSVGGWVLRVNGSIKWAQKMLRDLGIKQQPMATLYCDNQSTIKEIENNGNSQVQKHLAKKPRSNAERVGRGRLEIQYVSTTSNFADIFTKPLGPCVFERLRDQLNLEDEEREFHQTRSVVMRLILSSV
ncbi:hypothetical protein PHPALM_27925 [Phytophthora palmivora]|uniref:Reverse transcriptase Ty1/copia-type domain-containing protein n=1 Tax=Phytophthora palmivora TaxID=4796 RepID=A0A2P4XBC6_9STRA|nr:hypothetical protein PHPALM_27925 [Phytophthora palmivora]